MWGTKILQRRVNAWARNTVTMDECFWIKAPQWKKKKWKKALLPHSDECQHTTSVPPSSPPSDRDDLSASSLSAPLRPPHRQLLHIPLNSCSAKIRRHFQEEVRHIHLHSGQHRHHAADRDLAAPSRWRGQVRRPCSAWVLGPLLPPLCRRVRRKRRKTYITSS